MSFFLPQVSNLTVQTEQLKAIGNTQINVKYRDSLSATNGTATTQADKLKFDLTNGFDEQILATSVRFKIGTDIFIDRAGAVYRNVDPSTGSGTATGTIQYGTGKVELSSWTPNLDNNLVLQSLITTTDLPPINQVQFRIPVIPIRAGSLTVVLSTVDRGQLTLRANDEGLIETGIAHGSINQDTGFVELYFYEKIVITESNRTQIEAQSWYSLVLEYEEAGAVCINVPIWVVPESLRYNAVAYSYIPLDAEQIGVSATRLPLDGRVPIFRMGDVAVISSSKIFELPDHIPGKTYQLNHQRISYCELVDSNGVPVPQHMYTVDYDYGKFTLGGDFALNALLPPLASKYRYQDMAMVKDIQINGQLTFNKPVTHHYDANDTIVGSTLGIGDMYARYSRKFVQQTWNNTWADEESGGSISANYNDVLYPISVSNAGSAQERWALVFTNANEFKCVGESMGELSLRGSTSIDYAPINPVTGQPYFIVKKEGWGAGWANGNALRFNTISATYPIWMIRTVSPSEPTLLSDHFQIMLHGDIDREI